MYNQFAGGPSLPGWCLYPASAAFCLVILYVILRTRGAAGKFVIFACWFRYMLSALHEHTWREAVGALTWNALASVAVIGLGVLVVDKRRFLVWPLAPVALICLLMAVSGVLNHDPGRALEPILRFIYFTVICVASWQALETAGPTFLKRLLWAFLPALTFQLLSIGLGVTKSGEIDGSVSYIGGYFHEQLFSLILATLFLVTTFAIGIGRVLRFVLSIAALVGIYLANYRTTILGIAPLAAMQMITAIPRAFARQQRTFASAAIVMTAAALLVVAVSTQSERFADVGSVVSEGTGLIKQPETFKTEERRMLSGRPYIWSHYIYAYDEGTPLQRVIGFGPDAWVGLFPFYAHNTLVSFLFECGILGVFAILLLWASMFAVALRGRPDTRTKVVAAHLSFFLLNMATMPHWQIEGNILYGLLCGYTLAMARRPRLSDVRRPRAHMARPYTAGGAGYFQEQ